MYLNYDVFEGYTANGSEDIDPGMGET